MYTTLEFHTVKLSCASESDSEAETFTTRVFERLTCDDRERVDAECEKDGNDSEHARLAEFQAVGDVVPDPWDTDGASVPVTLCE